MLRAISTQPVITPGNATAFLPGAGLNQLSPSDESDGGLKSAATGNGLAAQFAGEVGNGDGLEPDKLDSDRLRQYQKRWFRFDLGNETLDAQLFFLGDSTRLATVVFTPHLNIPLDLGYIGAGLLCLIGAGIYTYQRAKYKLQEWPIPVFDESAFYYNGHRWKTEFVYEDLLLTRLADEESPLPEYWGLYPKEHSEARIFLAKGFSIQVVTHSLARDILIDFFEKSTGLTDPQSCYTLKSAIEEVLRGPFVGRPFARVREGNPYLLDLADGREFRIRSTYWPAEAAVSPRDIADALCKMPEIFFKHVRMLELKFDPNIGAAVGAPDGSGPENDIIELRHANCAPNDPYIILFTGMMSVLRRKHLAPEFSIMAPFLNNLADNGMYNRIPYIRQMGRVDPNHVKRYYYDTLMDLAVMHMAAKAK